MTNFLKKNWFVCLVIVLFACVSVYYIYDTNKGKLKGKSVDGENVVYSINDEDVTASSLYEELYKSNGSNAIVTLIEKAVCDQAVDTTSEMKETASSQASSIRSNYQSSYGDDYEAQLESDLKSTGFDDLEEYLIFAQKVNQISAEYAKNNFEELQIREISYILISFDDTSNPTEEATETEQSKMDAVDAALAEGTSFADVAKEYSEDSSTSESGGVLGIIDTNTTSLDSDFYNAAMALAEGEVSDWVRSDSFGYFRIECTAATAETLATSYTEEDPYLALVENYDTSLSTKALWAKIEELGIDFGGDTELEATVKTAFGVEDESSDDTTEESTEAESTASPVSTETTESEDGE